MGWELPCLHGNLAWVYRERATWLQEALAADGGPEIVEVIRMLIDRVEVHPPKQGARELRIELVGYLDTFCHWAAGGQRGFVCLADLASVRGLRGGSHMRRSDARDGPISKAASP
jgi:hypothetical protein